MKLSIESLGRRVILFALMCGANSDTSAKDEWQKVKNLIAQLMRSY